MTQTGAGPGAPATPSGPCGLRERKKARTRQAIYDAALALFLERGYAATTIADIADRADISPRTFFSYFESKEAVLFADLEPAFVRLEAVLAERPDGGTALEVLRRWVVEDVMTVPPPPPEVDRLLDGLMGDQGSTVMAHGLQAFARIERALARALAADLGSAPDDPTPDFVAAATIAALYRSTRGADGGPIVGDELVLARLDLAVAFVQHGLDGLHHPAGG